MAGLARQSPLPLPNLVVAQRVLDKMAAAARAWLSDETGEALVGLVEPGVHTNGVPGIYLLDTIAPDESALRMEHTFQQGDQYQDDLLWWQQENWRLRRQRDELPPHWDVPLRYLGDWHKQPGAMTRPSRGDLRTARDWLRDAGNDMDFLLAPIVTLHSHDAAAAANHIRIDEQTFVDFWYLQLRDRDFRAIDVTVYQDAQLPRLTATPWHLQQPERLEQEFARLQDCGFDPSPLVFLDLLDTSALDVCFMLGRAGAPQMLLVATPPDYPARPPQLRLTPSTGLEDEAGLHERFTQLWQDASPLPAPADWPWQPESTLAGLVELLERNPGLRTRPPAAETSRATLPDRDMT